MKRNIKNLFERLQNQPEDKKIRTVWILAIFCIIIVLSIWLFNFKGSKINFSSVIKESPDFQNQFSEINNDIEGLKNDSKAVQSQIINEQIRLVTNKFMIENNLISEDNLENIFIDSIEKINDIWVVNYRQSYQNIPLNENRIYFKIKDTDWTIIDYEFNYVGNIDLEIEPQISAEEVFEKIKVDLNDDSLEMKNFNLVIYHISNEEENDNYLAWKMSLTSHSFKKDYYYYINAINGNIISSFSL